MSKFNVDYFIAKFEAIPEEKWCIKTYSDGPGAHCALGHCGVTTSAVTDVAESEGLRKIFLSFPYGVATVNDGGFDCVTRFGDTPRTRVLAALRAIKGEQK